MWTWSAVEQNERGSTGPTFADIFHKRFGMLTAINKPPGLVAPGSDAKPWQWHVSLLHSSNQSSTKFTEAIHRGIKGFR
jgi:hypothetical protein